MADVESARRLVEQEDGRLGCERPGDDEALALTAAERIEPAAAELGEVEAFEHVVHHRSVMPRLRREIPDVRRAPEQDVLEAGHVLGHQRDLRDVSDERGAP
jgi:hypothetical protein